MHDHGNCEQCDAIEATARDVVVALCEHSSDYHATHAYRYGSDQAKCPDAICVSDRALLARPEAQWWAGR